CSGQGDIEFPVEKEIYGGTKMRNLLLCLVLACTASVWAMSDDSSEAKGKSDTRSITGCLAQGDSAKEFNLTADDGSTWEVRSSNVSLAEHVGHKVTVIAVSASLVSLASAAFSSSRVRWSKPAASGKPSCCAKSASDPYMAIS